VSMFFITPTPAFVDSFSVYLSSEPPASPGND
jgi:hypothetical protein